MLLELMATNDMRQSALPLSLACTSCISVGRMSQIRTKVRMDYDCNPFRRPLMVFRCSNSCPSASFDTLST